MIDLNKYFSPFRRTGLMRALGGTTKDRIDNNNGEYTFTIDVQINGESGISESVDFTLLNVNNVNGISPNAIHRTFPDNGAADVDPLLFPFIEFKSSDLPWRFSPLIEDANNKLHPWLCLVTIPLKNDQFDVGTQSFTINQTLLPDLAQFHAFAHVYKSDDQKDSISRIISPFRSSPESEYVCYLTPCLNSNGSYVWDNSLNQEITLQSYYRFTYKTGKGSELRRFISQLKKSDTVLLKRKTCCTNFSSEDLVIEIPTLLSAINEKESSFKELYKRDHLKEVLSNILSKTLPMYGKFQAGLRTLSVQKDWLKEINLDLRYRIVAGLGSKVIVENQERMMKTAWKHYQYEVEFSNDKNKVIDSYETSQHFLTSISSSFDDDSVVRFAAPILSKTRVKSGRNIESVTEHIKKSQVLTGTVDPQWNKVTKKIGHLGNVLEPNRTMIEKMNNQLFMAKLHPKSQKLLKEFKTLHKNKKVPWLRPSGYRILENKLKTRSTSNEDLNKTEISNYIKYLKQEPKKLGQNSVLNVQSLIRDIKLKTQPKFLLNEKIRKRFSQEPSPPDLNIDIPLFELLKKKGTDWIFPNLNKLEDSTVSFFHLNTKFLESFMIGANHELSREILWREFPVSNFQTFLKSFWAEGDTSIEPDIKSKWTSLGVNTKCSSSIVIMCVKSPIVKELNESLVYLSPAETKDNGYRGPSDNQSDLKFPLFTAFVSRDTALVGIPLKESELVSSSNRNGYYLMFEQKPKQLLFGLNKQSPNSSNTWTDLSFNDLETKEGEYLNLNTINNLTRRQFRPQNSSEYIEWGKLNSAHHGLVLQKSPIRIAVHFDNLLTTKSGE